MMIASANSISKVLDSSGKPFEKAATNGHSRKELVDAFQTNGRARAGYDAARDTIEFERYWQHADSLSADSLNNPQTRLKLRNRSRYEAQSNGFYDGILESHVNMLVGVGPTLRMLTQDVDFNEMVERVFWEWTQRVQLRRKLWCMAHALCQDGEGFAMLQTNPAFDDNDVQLDLLLIEAEQCQTPVKPFEERYTDGIRYDRYNNILWYDVLPEHPGGDNVGALSQRPLRVPPDQMLHWFHLKRPGQHRGVPALTSTLNTGANARRYREAVVTGAETAANFPIMLETELGPDEDPILEPSVMDYERRMMTALPRGTKANGLKANQPTSEYPSFLRSLICEQARPLSMPYNAAACDSSTYSFASGKLDMLLYRAAVDVFRQDCNDLALEKILTAFFSEWRLLNPGPITSRGGIPRHQWDWPAHPVIDAVAEAEAVDVRLHNGTLSLRDAYTSQGQDFNEQLVVMTEDYFGEASDENVAEMRRILRETHYPVAVKQEAAPSGPRGVDAAAKRAERNGKRFKRLMRNLEPELSRT